MPEFQTGEVFVNHRIEGLAGRGGMGVVYRATQLPLDRVVALKVIAPALADEEDFRARFVAESKAAASIEHPNVIPVYYAGERAGVLFIVMRYVDGPDLRALVRGHGALEPDRAAHIVSQVGAALDAAHVRGLVHRDVKPANVLLTDEDHAYLTDFGLTKSTAATSGLSRTSGWVGTLGYVSPEQIRGDRVDARSDVYALGCVLVHALTGQAPFVRDSDEATMWAHLNAPPPDESVPPEFAAVVSRALAKDPSDRYPSAGDLGRAVLVAAGRRASPEPERLVARGTAAPEDAPTPATPTARVTDERAREDAGETRPSPPAEEPRPVELRAPARDVPPTSEAPPAARESPPAREDPPPPEPPADYGDGDGDGEPDDAQGEWFAPAMPAARAPSPPPAQPPPPAPPPAHAPPPDHAPTPAPTPSGTQTAVTPTQPTIPAHPGAQAPAEPAGAPVAPQPRPAGPRAPSGGGLAAELRGRGSWIGAAGLIVVAAVAAVVLAGGGEPQTPDRPQSAAPARDLEPTVGEPVPVGARPNALTVAGGTVWVLSGAENNVALVDAETGQRSGRYSIGQGGMSIAAGFDSVWIVKGSTRTLLRVDSRTRRRVGEPISLPQDGQPVALATGEDAVWVAVRSGVPGFEGPERVVRVTPSTGAQQVITVQGGVQDLAVGEDAVWISNRFRNSVVRLSPSTGRQIEIPVGAAPQGLAVGEGAVWVAAEGDDALSRINPVSRNVTEVPLNATPARVTVGGGSVWVTARARGELLRVHPERFRVRETLDVGQRPFALEVSEEDTVWVSLLGEDAVRGVSFRPDR